MHLRAKVELPNGLLFYFVANSVFKINECTFEERVPKIQVFYKLAHTNTHTQTQAHTRAQIQALTTSYHSTDYTLFTLYVLLYKVLA